MIVTLNKNHFQFLFSFYHFIGLVDGKSIESYLRIWGRYEPIESGLTDWGVMLLWRKKSVDFGAKKCVHED